MNTVLSLPMGDILPEVRGDLVNGTTYQVALIQSDGLASIELTIFIVSYLVV